MKREIDARRRVRISVRAGEGTLKGTYLFDAKGALLATEEGEAPGRGLSAFLSSQIREMPRVSGSEAREALWEGERISLSILRYIHMTLGELTDLQAARIPDKEGIVDCGQRRRLTYRELKELSDALAVSLIRLGLKKGDKAAVIMDNCWQNLVTKAAIEKIGAVIVNLNIHEKGEMLITLLRDTDAKAVLIRQGIKSREHMELLFGMCPELMEQGPEEICCSLLPELKHVIVTDREKPRTCALQFEDLLEEGLQGDREILRQRKEEISPLDTVTIIHTSGSSGKPKGVLLTHAQLIESAWSHVEKMHLTPEDRFYMTSPMFHALGCIGSALASMTVGSTLVFHGFARCESLLSLLEQEQCTVFSSVPTVYLRLLELAQGEQWRGRLPLRLCITAGASMPGKGVCRAGRGLRRKGGPDHVRDDGGRTGHHQRHHPPGYTAGGSGSRGAVAGRGGPDTGCVHRTAPSFRGKGGDLHKELRRHAGLLQESGGDEAGAGHGRLAPYRRYGIPIPGGQAVSHRKMQGPDHPRRREYKPWRGGGISPAESAGGGRGGGGRPGSPVRGEGICLCQGRAGGAYMPSGACGLVSRKNCNHQNTRIYCSA